MTPVEKTEIKKKKERSSIALSTFFSGLFLGMAVYMTLTGYSPFWTAVLFALAVCSALDAIIEAILSLKE